MKMVINGRNQPWIIEGHTDDVGTKSSNNRLSRKRAKAVINALNQLGVTGGIPCPKGETEFKHDPNKDLEENRADHRKILFKFQKNCHSLE